LHAEFSITEQQLEELKSAAQYGAKVLRDFTVEVKDRSGEVVAIIIKTLYVRQKRKM
jgi:aspartokinase